MKKIIISLCALVIVIIGVQVATAAPAPRDENRNPSVLGADCTTTTVARATVGDDLSSNILSTTTLRAYARIELPVLANGIATSTVFLSFNQGVSATVNTGITLSTSTPFIEVGLNTNFPYTGTITGITNGTASTTVLITSCSF